MKALIINLEKDVDKMKNISKQCNTIGISFTRIDAVSGKNMDKKDKKLNTSDWCFNYCTNTMIGCWLSHVKCWEYIVANNLDNVLILEDDALFDKNFKEKFNEISSKIPCDWEMIILGQLINILPGDINIFSFPNSICKILQGRTDIFDNGTKIDNNLYKTNFFTGAHSYILRNSCAKKFLQIFSKAEGHIDMSLSDIIGDINCYSIYPSLVTQDSSFETSQSIDYPASFNFFLNDIKNVDNFPVSTMFRLPLMKIENYDINGWTFIFFFFGIISFYSKFFFLFIIVLLLYEFCYNTESLYQVIGSFVSFLTGYFIKKTLRNNWRISSS